MFIVPGHERKEKNMSFFSKFKKNADENEIQEKDVYKALSVVMDPDLKKDIVSLGFIKDLEISGSTISFKVELTSPACPVKKQLEDQSRNAVMALEGVEKVEVQMTSRVRAGALPEKKSIPGVKNIIAVSSAKGGVGKSTVSVNLAFSLSQSGARVGLLDTDIYGPSIPMMLGIKTQLKSEGENILPAMKDGLQVVSMGFLTDDNTPVIWRGPMVHGLIKQFLEQVKWNDLDYLVMDLPPGTGDVQLTLVQLAPITGAVIVTTPQDIALLDVKKGVSMFKKTKVPILGIVENMSHFSCPHCEKKTDIFGKGGGQKVCDEMDVDLLGEIPLMPEVRKKSDQGRTVVLDEPDSEIAKTYRDIGSKIISRLSVAAMSQN